MAKDWKFVTKRDRVVTASSTAAGLAVLGLGLSFVFNPVAIGVAAGLGAVSAVRLSRSAYRKKYANRLIKSGSVEAVADDAPITGIVADISTQLGMKDPPKIYTIKNSYDAGAFAAVPGANIILTTKAALTDGMSEKELRFVAAHELSHLKAKDNRSLGVFGLNTVAKTARYLVLGCIIAAGASLFGAALPVVAAAGTVTLLTGTAIAIGSYIAAKVAMKSGQRTMEQRADRNALYITRDLESGKSALARVYPEKLKKVSLFKEAFMDHPSLDRRIKIMTKAFKKVSKQPLLQETAVPVTVTTQSTANNGLKN